MIDSTGTTELHQAFFPHVFVSEMETNSLIVGYYVLQSAAVKTSTSGKPFLSASLTDNSGSISVVFWNYSGQISPADDGKVVFIKGLISEFKGSLQITLDMIRLAQKDESINLDDLIPSAPVDVEQMYLDILHLTDSIQDKDYLSICREFLRRHSDAFRNIPAAKSVHHRFLHGLLMHTGYMLKIADNLANLYPQVIDRSLLIAGTLLHDFSKREEFTFSQIGLVSGYSVKGQLLGHLVMGAQEVGEISTQLDIPEEKTVLLQHMLLSHHGKPEYGAAVVPMCAESELLSMIDMIDSRMEIYRENLEQTPLGEFSSRIFALDGNRIFHHYDSPSQK